MQDGKDVLVHGGVLEMSIDLVKALVAYTESLHPIIYLHHFDFYELEQSLTKINPHAKYIGFDAACGFTGVVGGSADNNSVNLSTTVSSNTTANTAANTSANRASASLNAVSFLQPPHYLYHVSSLSEFLAAVFNEGFEQSTFLVLKHVHHLLHDAAVISNLSRIAEYTLHHPDFSMTVFIESSVVELPVELEHFITVFELPQPSTAEIYEMIGDFAKVQQISVLPSVMTTLACSLHGLDAFQIQKVLSLAYHEGGGLDEKDKFIIQQEKLRLIKNSHFKSSHLLENSNLLEIVEPTVDGYVRAHSFSQDLDANQVEGYSGLDIYNAALWSGAPEANYGYNKNDNGDDNRNYNSNGNRADNKLRGVTPLSGLDKLKYCLYHKSTLFKNLSSVLEFGVELPRGVLITGLPGCGKTTMLETAARWFEVPVLRLNTAMLWEQSLSNTALKLQQALDLVDKVSPCVLLIDELEQVFTASSEMSKSDSSFTTSAATSALSPWANRGGYNPHDGGRNPQESGFNLLYGSRSSQEASFNLPNSSRNPKEAALNPQNAVFNPPYGSCNPYDDGRNPQESGLNPQDIGFNPHDDGAHACYVQNYDAGYYAAPDSMVHDKSCSQLYSSPTGNVAGNPFYNPSYSSMSEPARNATYPAYGEPSIPNYSHVAHHAYNDALIPVYSHADHRTYNSSVPAYGEPSVPAYGNVACTNTYTSSGTNYSKLSTPFVPLLNQFMQWMQHKNRAVFVMASVNDISVLPPKILHQGCFDEIFFIELPDEATRYEIFKIHLEKHRQWSQDLDMQSLVEQSIGCSGADIEWVVRSAIEKAFITQQLEVTTQNLLDSLHELKPTAVLFKDKINLLRQYKQKFHLHPAN